MTTKKAAPRASYVALLRGINVGGKNKLPMAALSAMFVEAGCGDVKTLIQSGNVVFSAPPALASTIAAQVTQAIADGFGLAIPLVIRTAEDLAAVSRDNPFLQAGEDPEKLHVGFLADTPAEAAIASLDPARSAPDRFLVRGREVYLHLPNGVARSKLTNAYFDGRLQTVTTIRNWRTVLALVEMCCAVKARPS